MSLAEDIAIVRQGIQAKGWCQHAMYHEGRACLSGAIVRTLPAERMIVVMKFINSVVDEELGGPRYSIPHSSIPYYNDRVLTCTQDALDFLDKCIIKAEEKVSD